MITVKTERELELMSEACKIAAIALKAAGKHCQAGITTKELDSIIKKEIISNGATPSFLGYGGFPCSACISINDELIHGIPSSRKIVNGDIVSIDVGAFYNGYHGDNAYTFAVGNVSKEAIKLLEVTKQSLYEAINSAKVGSRIGDISHAVENYVTKHGFFIVKDFVGHGIGKNLHERPEVPNFGQNGRGVRLVAGMTIAIEPMVNLLGEKVFVEDDNWTVKSESGSLSAHFEHTIAITENGPIILTKV